MVLSAYVLRSSRTELTCLRFVPSLAVFESIVCMDPILVSYSLKPSIIGSMVNDFVSARPALTARFVRFINAVVPIMPKVLNLLLTVSSALPTLSKPSPLTALPSLLIPLAASSRFDPFTPVKALFNFWKVDKDCLALDSKFSFSSFIDIIFSSIGLAIYSSLLTSSSPTAL
ncbi:Uncharacterised protein [Chlamydia trachomatis]|nr:Uncharacterised protein [Chlamydia trachomatis]